MIHIFLTETTFLGPRLDKFKAGFWNIIFDHSDFSVIIAELKYRIFLKNKQTNNNNNKGKKKHLFLDLFGIHVYAWRKSTLTKTKLFTNWARKENDMYYFFNLQNHLQRNCWGKLEVILIIPFVLMKFSSRAFSLLLVQMLFLDKASFLLCNGLGRHAVLLVASVWTGFRFLSL